MKCARGRNGGCTPPGMDYPFRGHGPIFLLLLAYMAGLFLGLASGPAWPSLAAGGILPAFLCLPCGKFPLAAALSVMAPGGPLAPGRIPVVRSSRFRVFLGNEVVLRADVKE